MTCAPQWKRNLSFASLASWGWSDVEAGLLLGSQDGCQQGHGHVLPCLCPLGNSSTQGSGRGTATRGVLETYGGGGRLSVWPWAGPGGHLPFSLCGVPILCGWQPGAIFPLSHYSPMAICTCSALLLPKPCPAPTELPLMKPQDIHTAGPADSHSVSHRPRQTHPWLIGGLVKTCLYVLVCGSFFHLRCLPSSLPCQPSVSVLNLLSALLCSPGRDHFVCVKNTLPCTFTALRKPCPGCLTHLMLDIQTNTLPDSQISCSPIFLCFLGDTTGDPVPQAGSQPSKA